MKAKSRLLRKEINSLIEDCEKLKKKIDYFNYHAKECQYYGNFDEEREYLMAANRALRLENQKLNQVHVLFEEYKKVELLV